jgi:hypothetical protein
LAFQARALGPVLERLKHHLPVVVPEMMLLYLC